MARSSLVAALVFAGCWTPTPPDGAYACNPSGKACPDGYSCITGSCWKNGHGPDMGIGPTCANGTKDDVESDVDCGGACAPCDIGKVCRIGIDCASGFCSAMTSLCVATSCDDGVKSAGESDIDCGGSCAKCVVGKSCTSASDCASDNCDGSTQVCRSQQCEDGVKNGNETDVDCGGSVCAACVTGKKCVAGTDCASSFCAATSHVCVANRCEDELKNGSETDKDCGGSCPGCGADRACNVPGDCATGSCLKSFCALISGPPIWLPVASISPRLLLAAATGGDGKIYAIGGADGGGTGQTTVEAYTPNSWTSAASYPTATSSFCATAALDGTIYGIGGSAGGSPVAAVYILTPGSGWATGPAYPAGVNGAACATGADGKIYSIAGSVSGGSSDLAYALTPGGNWTAIANAPKTETFPAAALGADNRIYLTGGLHPTGGTGLIFDSAVFAYSPAQNQWAAVADLSAGRVEHAAVQGADGRIYVFGGSTLAASPTGECEAYSPASNVWVPCKAMTPRKDLAGALGADGRIYAIGGATPTVTGVVEAYGPNVAMSPTAGRAGMSVAISGSNFAQSANVSVRFGVRNGQVLGTGVTDSNGALVAPINFNIPSMTPAAYKIFVSDDRSQYPVNVTLTIQP